MSQRTLLALFLLFLATTCFASSQPPKLVYKQYHYTPFSVQQPFNGAPTLEKRKDVKQSNVWAIPVQATLSGSLLSDVKHRRAAYEATESELYLISTPNSKETTKVECTRGDGWFYSVENLPNSQICLPWSFWSQDLIRRSSIYAVAGQALCSAPVPLEHYPQCGLGYHCNVDKGKCELSKLYKIEIPGFCPPNSGLVWSRSKGRCVQCITSNLRFPKYTSGIMPPDYFRLGYVCDSDGNAYPPLTVNMSQQLYLIPSGFFNLCICIVMVLLGALYVAIYFHDKQQRNKYKIHRNSS